MRIKRNYRQCGIWLKKHGLGERILAGRPDRPQKYLFMWWWRYFREGFRYRPEEVVRYRTADYQVSVANRATAVMETADRRTTVAVLVKKPHRRGANWHIEPRFTDPDPIPHPEGVPRGEIVYGTLREAAVDAWQDYCFYNLYKRDTDD